VVSADQASTLGALATDERSMAEQKPETWALLFNLGDRVKIQLSGGMHKRIVQYQY